MVARDPIGVQRRWSLLQRDGFTCAFCGWTRPGNDLLRIDHMIPHSIGGSDHDNNLITTCERCNSGKSDSISIPLQWCEPNVDAQGFRIWKRWKRWSMRWSSVTAVICLDESEFDWVTIDRIHNRHLFEHLKIKYAREQWNGADAGLADAWSFCSTLIRGPS